MKAFRRPIGLTARIERQRTQSATPLACLHILALVWTVALVTVVFSEGVGVDVGAVVALAVVSAVVAVVGVVVAAVVGVVVVAGAGVGVGVTWDTQSASVTFVEPTAE